MFRLIFPLLVLIAISFPLVESRFGWVGPAFIWCVFGVGVVRLICGSLIDGELGKRTLCDAWFLFHYILVVFEMLMIGVYGWDVQGKYFLARVTLLALSISVAMYLVVTGIDGWRRIQKVLVFGGVLLCVVMILQMLGLHAIGFETYEGRVLFGLQFPVKKVTGFLMSDGRLGTILVPVLILTYASTKYPNNYYFPEIKYSKYCLGLLLMTIFFSQSRSMYLACVVAAIVIYLLSDVRKYRIFKYLFGAICFLIVVSQGAPVMQSIIGEGRLAENIFERGFMVNFAYSQWLSSPMFGVGHQNMTYETAVSQGVTVHNMFANQLGAMGLLGAVPLLLMFTIPIFRMTKTAMSADNYRDAEAATIYSAVVFAIVIELSNYRGLYNEFAVIYMTMVVVVGMDFRRSLVYEVHPLR